MSAWTEYLGARNAVLEPSSSAADAPLRIARFGEIGSELSAAWEGAIACPLLDWSAISVAGVDARSFLQGQFTNDLDGLAPGAVQLNGYCSPKGRLLANFALACIAPDEFILVVPAEIASGFVRRLRMFLLRAKAVVAPLDSSQLIGRHGPGGDTPAPASVQRREATSLIGLPDGRVIAICDSAHAVEVWEVMSRSATPVGSPVWDALAIGAGVPAVTAATQDKFVPQMLNWELLGGVSFRKGCYTGQEIVARMQYLGRLKERLYRGHTSVADPKPGDALFGEQFGDQSCGTIVNAAPSLDGGTDVLAVLQIASAERDVIRFAPGTGGPVLDLVPLPYDVPGALVTQGG